MGLWWYLWLLPYARLHSRRSVILPALTAGLCVDGVEHFFLCSAPPNCLGLALIILLSDGLQCLPMTHCTGWLCLLPKHLSLFRACVYFTGQLTLGQCMILLNKHYVGEHCYDFSSIARRTVGQLWGTRGHVVMSVNIGPRKVSDTHTYRCMDHTWMHVSY